MPDLLGITNPVPGYDNSSNNRNPVAPPTNPQIQNAPDPSRVMGPDGRTEQQDAGAQFSEPRFDSNFQTFLQRLKETPDLTAILSRYFSGQTRTVVASGMSEGIAQQISKFMAMLQMDRTQFVRFVSEQFQTGTRFNGPLFGVLRSAYQKTDSEGMQTDILQFLKRYSNYSSTRHIEENLMRNLNQMARAVPASWGNRMMPLVVQFTNGIQAGNRAQNLKLLQGEILPFMSDYVGRTHDLGRARGLISLLALDIARYENGSEEKLLQAFEKLKNYAVLRDRFGNLDEQTLLRILYNTNFIQAEKENSFVNQLVDVTEQALRGMGGVEAQSTFQELISTILTNESVYMTVNHFIIPLEWNGKMMFSEVWIDPDAESERNKAGDSGNTLRLLLKIDIQSLGFFDLVMSCQGTTVDLQIQCPEKVAPFTGVVEKSMKRILTENGLQARLVQVKKMEKPFVISEVFPKIFKGKDSVNVKV